ncbi:MAG: ATP-dependent zinc metalloprotease FtsH [Oligoflexia bacterium]|nr:ATP-dependent zinc metalloprotease FtsH [Oligoflexia bacterium]
MRQSQKTLALWVTLVLVGVMLYQMYDHRGSTVIADFNFAKFLKAVEAGEVETTSVTFRDNGEILGEIKETAQQKYGGKQFHIMGPTNSDEVFKAVRSAGVTPNWENTERASFMMAFLTNWLPLGLIFFMFLLFMRQIQAGGGKAMSFGKSRARLLTENKNRVTFKDVAGIEEAKEELEEIIQFLKDPKRFTKLGGRIPKGVLLMGPPGTGKTLLARAIAGEAGVPFFSISGSDFVEMFVGVGASRVRDLFEQGKKNAPCLIFIDEIDAVGRHRGAGLGGGHDEREQTLNQLLVEMDGFEGNMGVILIAATNRPDVLDPALLRPGRFDRRVVVNKPDVKGREQILNVHTRKSPLAGDVDLAKIARGTPGFSGADLESLVNEAALLAARKNKTKLEMDDFELAKDKVMMGAERKSMVISDEEKKVTAYHEAGHALVGKLTPGTDPIHKVTIIPRGMALGLTQTLPEKERLNLTNEAAENNIAFLMGGRCAEELVFGNYTTGAGNDIERATDIAHRMVCEWGMSKLGPLTYGKREEQIFLGREISKTQDYSESTAEAIDKEVKDIVMRNYERAKKILSERIQILHVLANALVSREVLDGSEVDMLVQGKTLADIDEERKRRADLLKAEADRSQASEATAESKEEEKNKTVEGNPKPVQA